MLKRKIYDDLVKWKSQPNRKCLIVKGARQVGKTFIIDKFARENYENYLYLNFDNDKSAFPLFEKSSSVDEIIMGLSAMYRETNFVPGKTLIFMDEIQNCPDARTSIKMFTIDGRYDVISSGSLMGVKYKDVRSYPVGYEISMTLQSLDFEEFLWAINVNDTVICAIKDSIQHKTPLNEGIFQAVSKYYRWYILTGGMPEVVLKFLETKNFKEVLKVQQSILSIYLEDTAKYAPALEKNRIGDAFRSIPSQLAKRNKKFQYRFIDPNCKNGERTYGYSLTWLFDAGLINYCYNLDRPSVPLAFNIKINSFKIYLMDTGLLMAMSESGSQEAILVDELRAEEGGIVENAIAEQLSKNGITLTYFEKRGSLEIDFVVNLDGEATAIEVKSGNTKMSKSLDVVMSDKYQVKRGIMFELGNIYVDKNGVEHYPLFASAFISSMQTSKKDMTVDFDTDPLIVF